MSYENQPDELTDFQKGARAVFDSVQFRAANHYHDDPQINVRCDGESKLVLSWVQDALEKVDPESVVVWKTMNAMFKDGVKVGKALGAKEEATKQIDEQIDDHISSLKMMIGFSSSLCTIAIFGVLLMKDDALVMTFGVLGMICLAAAFLCVAKGKQLTNAKRVGWD